MFEINTINVNSNVLIWARESLALSRNQVSERTNISNKRIVQLEEGEKFPTLNELRTLSKTYKRTLATLLLTEVPKEKPLPKDRRTIDSKEIGVFNEKTIIAIRKARALAKSFIELKEEMGFIIPKFSYSVSINESPINTAIRFRSILNLNEIRELENTNHILEAYIEKLESIGVAIFQLSLTQDNLRGFSIIDDVIPIIGIKRGSENPTSKIFTLFHEFGHILLNEGGLCDLKETSQIEIEKWCNAFAAEILIPTKELLNLQKVIEHKLSGEKIWSKSELIEIGNFFHVGPLAILRSLLNHKLTTSSFYNEKHLAWNKPQYGRSKNPEGRNIPKEAIKEKGKTYISLAFKAFDLNRIDLKDLSDFLGVKLSYIQKTRQLLNA